MPSQSSTEIERLAAIVRAFEGRPVAVLGDLVADEFVYGDIARISREAPVLILEHRRTDVVPGGGGNAVANLAALGARPLPVGVVGDDESGSRLRAAFEQAGIDGSGILTYAGYDTPAKSRILAGGVHTRRQQVVRLDRGNAGGELPDEAQQALGRVLADALAGADGLLVADYGFGAATPGRLDGVRAAVTDRKLPVMLDSRSRVTAFHGASACTPNQEELERALGLDPLDDDGAVIEAAWELRERTGSEALLVTRGALGMCLVERDAEPCHIPAFGSDEVADVTGAGDTVIAVFTLAFLSGASFVDAARLANYAAGLVVQKAGTATIDREELVAALREDLEP